MKEVVHVTRVFNLTVFAEGKHLGWPKRYGQHWEEMCGRKMLLHLWVVSKLIHFVIVCVDTQDKVNSSTLYGRGLSVKVNTDDGHHHCSTQKQSSQHSNVACHFIIGQPMKLLYTQLSLGEKTKIQMIRKARTKRY